MRIAVVGCGAVGSYYGAKLCRDNQEVHFLLRSDYDTVRRKGVTIRSREGDFNVRPKCARTPHAIGPCDLVLIGLKTTWNIPFNGLGVASCAGLEAVAGRVDATRIGPCLTTDRLLQHPQWSLIARELMGEGIAVARALGLTLPEALVDKQIERTLTM